jgi:hypothetical protein
LNKQIIQYSAIIDLNESTEEIRKNIRKAEEGTKEHDREVIATYSTSVRYIREQAKTESAYNSLSESMVIFEPGTNEKANDWISNGMNLLGVAGGVVAYSGFKDSNNVLGVSSVIVTTLAYVIGQNFITKNKNKDTQAKKSFEALSRNVVYANIIREDSANLANFQQKADLLASLIDYVDANSSGEVKSNWIPTSNVIDLSYLLLSDMENSLVFWNGIILSSNEILLKSSNFLSEDGKKNLQSNITKAQNLITVRKDNILRFRSKLYYLEKQFSEQNKSENKVLRSNNNVGLGLNDK